jgi:hypothetical protein
MTVMNEIKKFNAEGNRAFEELLVLKPGTIKRDLKALISNSDCVVDSKLASSTWKVPTSRREIGESLYPFLGPGGPLRSFVYEAGLWNWISAVFLAEQSDPSDIVGKKIDSWLVNDDGQRYYRHRFMQFYFVYEEHIADLDSVAILLERSIAGPFGELAENLLATPEFVHGVAIKVANELYFDKVTRSQKSGATNKINGGVRRLTTDFLNQVKLNLDYQRLSVSEILDILPREFDRFKGRESTRKVLEQDADFDEAELIKQLDL